MWIVCGILVNFELYIIKASGTGLQYSTTILKPFAALLFFNLLLNSKRKMSDKSINYAQCSTVIYFLHITVRNILVVVIKDYYVVWFLSVGICICIAKLLINMSERRELRWIQMFL